MDCANRPHLNLTQAEENNRFLDIFSNMQAEMLSLKHPSYKMWDLDFVKHEKAKVLLEISFISFANGFLELISIPTRISRTVGVLLKKKI